MVHPNRVGVNLADNQAAVVDNSGLRIEDRRAYSPRTVASMSLEDAITLAKAILSFADETADEQAIRQYEEAQDARYDAISASWGHD